MAKLLVADDNSNIQKMVALALKDQGIEVVAVGNGEAAVRKIPDFRPDVVLADVFMPVRNGYEVCEFIKKNDKLSHIPVILLVGAFDPLDEQEAQRVGADGVLKKPFVPPDPLISMVKSALARTGADKPVPVAVGVSSSAAPVISSIPAVAPSEFAAPEVSPGPPLRAAEEAPARPQPFSIDEGHSPLAFGSLLDSATAEKQEEADESFMPAPRSGLAEERNWNTPAAEEEEEEPEEIPSWRSGVDDLFDSPAAVAKNRVSDWRDAVPGAPQGSLPAVEGSPAVEATAPAEEPQSAFASPFTESPFSHRQNEQTPVSAEPEPVEEANVEAPPTEPFPPPSSFTPENYPGLFVEEKAVLTAPPPESTEEPFVEQEFIPPAGSRSNWEEEVRRAARMVTAWETASAPQPEAPAFSSFELPAGDGSATSSHEAQWPSHPPAASDPAPAAQFDPPDWYRKFQATPTQAEQQETAPAPPAAEPAQAPDMDALVAKVLEKMSPNVLQQVTRDILKPMVEALVRDELDKKK